MNKKKLILEAQLNNRREHKALATCWVTFSSWLANRNHQIMSVSMREVKEPGQRTNTFAFLSTASVSCCPFHAQHAIDSRVKRRWAAPGRPRIVPVLQRLCSNSELSALFPFFICQSVPFSRNLSHFCSKFPSP